MIYFSNGEMYANAPRDRCLQHHGILGMHWGVRRYQNEDGTLTDWGKARLQNEGMETNQMKNIAGAANSVGGLANAWKTNNHTYSERATKEQLADKSDEELRNAYNRYVLEENYKKTLSPTSAEVKEGKKNATLGYIALGSVTVASVATIASKAIPAALKALQKLNDLAYDEKQVYNRVKREGMLRVD